MSTPARSKPPRPQKPRIQDDISIDDYVLPRTTVTRLAKSVLPESTNLQKEAINAVQKSSIVFVNFLLTAANEHARSQKRKNINTKDLLAALDQSEYTSFRKCLDSESRKWQENYTQKQNVANKAKSTESEAAGTVPKKKDEAPATKKARVTEDVNKEDQTQHPEDRSEEDNRLEEVSTAESEEAAESNISSDEVDEDDETESFPGETHSFSEVDELGDGPSSGGDSDDLSD